MNNNGNREDPDSTRIEYISANGQRMYVLLNGAISSTTKTFSTLLPIDDYDLKPCVDDVMALDISKKSISEVFIARGMVTDMNEDQVYDTALCPYRWKVDARYTIRIARSCLVVSENQ
jgi:hypothetical protein